MKKKLNASKILIASTLMFCLNACILEKQALYQSQANSLEELSPRVVTLPASDLMLAEASTLLVIPNLKPESILNKTQIRVYYATDRKSTGMVNGVARFGAARGASVSYGIAEVSIPAHRCIGELNTPTWWKLEFDEDPAKHIIVSRTQSINKATYFSALGTVAKQEWDNAGLLFIHGYNVDFQDATKRAAQLACDIEFSGPTMLFSWPSKGWLIPYNADEASIRWSTPHIERFIESVLDTKSIQKLYIIAHSMGNRGTTEAIINLLQRRPDLKTRIKEIILAAPDIDADTFVEDIAPKLSQYKNPITLYVSSKDKALVASRVVHRSAQAGDSESSIVVVPGIETVDASMVSTSALGHSYIMEERALLSDLYQIIHYGARAATRYGLSTSSYSGKLYYVVRP